MSNKTSIIISIICFSLTIGLCIFLITHNRNKELTDALKFKKQFEDVSSIENPYTKEKYINIEISEENPFIYKTGKEIVDILKNESALIFMGYPESDLTRIILPIFIDVLKDNRINQVYYLDIFDIRDEYKYAGSIVPELVHEGTNAYKEIVLYLDSYLPRYYVEDPDGNRYDTAVKRVYTPTFMAVKNGEIIGYYSGVSTNHTEDNYKLNDEEKEMIKKELQELISKYKEATEVCSSDSAC